MKKKGWIDNIETVTTENDDYRRVLYTGKYMQLVLMALQPGEEIGAEVHDTHDQFIRVESGEGELELDGAKHKLGDDDAVVIPAGAMHNVTNTGNKPLKLYTLYGPPEHRDGVLQATKADETEEHFDGKTTE